MSSSRTRRTAVVAATAAVLLSSCGMTDSQVAARIGDQEVSMESVDRFARAICEVSEEQFEEAGQTVSMERLRQSALNGLAVRAVAELVADEYGVRPSAEYGRFRAQVEDEAETLPEELRADYVDGQTVDVLLQDVFVGAGEAELEKEGVTDADEQEVLQRGIDVVRTWPERYDLEVNPVFDVVLDDGLLQPGTGSNAVGVAASETALAAAATAEDPSLASGLPAHLRCG